MPGRTVYWIAKNDFKKAFRVVPIDGQVLFLMMSRAILRLAILHDKRISQGNGKK